MILNPHEYSKLVCGPHDVDTRFKQLFGGIIDSRNNIQWFKYLNPPISHKEATETIERYNEVNYSERKWRFPTYYELESLLISECEFDPIFGNEHEILWMDKWAHNEKWADIFSINKDMMSVKINGKKYVSHLPIRNPIAKCNLWMVRPNE